MYTLITIACAVLVVGAAAQGARDAFLRWHRDEVRREVARQREQER
jgi:hypothetical protein